MAREGMSPKKHFRFVICRLRRKLACLLKPVKLNDNNKDTSLLCKLSIFPIKYRREILELSSYERSNLDSFVKQDFLFPKTPHPILCCI
jgi:hypothetical protein